MTRTLVLLIFFMLVESAAMAEEPSADARTLKFFHTHTGDELEVKYYESGHYLPGAMSELKVFLADWRNGEEHEIDPELMDFLWEIQTVTGNRNTFEVISAYRSMKTNHYLRSKSKGVAQNSQHIQGKAIDVRLRGLDTRTLRDTALDLQLGGVGYYEKPDFVHVDTGRVRRW